MKILVGLLVFLIICIGFAFYGLFREDPREEDGTSRENLVKCRKKKFKQDFSGDYYGGMTAKNNEHSGIPHIDFTNGVREIMNKEDPNLLKTNQDIEMAVASESMRQMNEGII